MSNEKLIEILEAALYHINKSIHWYDLSQGDELSNEWEFSKQQDDLARGIMEAYQIITGNRITLNVITIREEISRLS